MFQISIKSLYLIRTVNNYDENCLNKLQRIKLLFLKIFTAGAHIKENEDLHIRIRFSLL